MRANETLYKIITPAVMACGFDVWGIEKFSRDHQTILRVYIDSENGIDIDDCATVSRQISAVMDVEDPIKEEYLLEVSSPGMDRLLFEPEQFSLYCGEQLKIKLRMAVNGARQFKGKLMRIEAGELEFCVDNQTFITTFDNIDKARVIPQFNQSK